MAPLALFDLDNTLLDRETAYRRWAAEFASVRGLPPGAVDRLVDLDGDGFTSRTDLFTQVRDGYSLGDSVDGLIGEYHRHYPTHFTFPDGSRSGLRALRAAGWRVGIVTNGFSFQQRKLDAVGLVDEVDGVCISDLVDAWKPDPAIFEEAARRCGPGCMAGWSATRVPLTSGVGRGWASGPSGWPGAGPGTSVTHAPTSAWTRWPGRSR